MSRKPSAINEWQSTEPGELLHADQCGPMENLFIGKLRDIRLIKDEFSHYKFIYFLSHKDEVKTYLKTLLKLIDT